MNYLIEPMWVAGAPGNGNTIWQCPNNCKQWQMDYSGTDPRIQFPRGERTHVKAGRADASTFHQGVPFQPERVKVFNGRNHEGVREPLLRMMGGDLQEQCQCMVVKKFDAPVKWEIGAKVILSTWFKPTMLGYQTIDDARQHLFSNIEFRGERTYETKHLANQVFGLFLRGNKIFAMYWSDTTYPATADSMVRFDFDTGIVPNEWHRLVMKVVASENPNEWIPKVSLRTKNETILRWVGYLPIKGNNSVHTVAFGDERPNDNDGGTFLWEKMLIYSDHNPETNV